MNYMLNLLDEKATKSSMILSINSFCIKKNFLSFSLDVVMAADFRP